MGSDPRTDRTWTLWRCPECGHTRFYEHGDPDQPCCNHSPACRQRSMTRVSVVEEARLREAEAERDRTKRSNDGLLDAVERLNETNDAELREAAASFDQLAIYLHPLPEGGHARLGEACGVDACILCLAETRAEEARDRARGVLDDGE